MVGLTATTSTVSLDPGLSLIDINIGQVPPHEIGPIPLPLIWLSQPPGEAARIDLLTASGRVAAGLPCVMTPIAAEGLPLSARLQDLVADTPQALAERILRYHSDRSANETAGREAMAMIASKADQRSVTQSLRSALVSGSAQLEPAAG
jgi:hypothetical protein